jgi:thiamine biosynthesis lipoprotein
VDVLADFLLGKGIQNMMVEVGGEAFCKGTNENGDIWRIGIEDPGTKAGGKPAQVAVKLDNKAIATSGNYRKTREINGKKYAHTISPFTGYPVEHSLLSASVFAEDAMTADGYATAFMVMGLEKAVKIVESNAGLDAFFVYSGEDGELLTYTSDGIAPFMVKLPE